MAKAKSLTRPAYVEIYTNRIVQNTNYLKDITKDGFFCPMLKADAYGHGDQEVAALMQKIGVRNIGVSTIDEAIQIRKSGFDKNILVYAASFQNTTKIIEEYNFIPVVSCPKHIEDLDKIKPIPIHVKLNTGMNRMGFDEYEIIKLLNWVKSKGLIIDGLLTHLFNGVDIGMKQGESQKQIKLFESLAQKYFSEVKVKHVYNSDALLNAKKPTYGARPGIAIYGYASKVNPNLLPAMEVKAKIVEIREIQRGKVVSYGGTWKASKKSKIAVLPLGYADGISRALSNKISFICNKKAVPQVGTICMDYLMIDVSKVKAQVGDVVSIVSSEKNYTAMDMAKKLKTIPYEVLTSMSERLPRIYLD